MAYYSCDFNIDLMQFRLIRWTHLSLGRCFFGFLFIQLLQRELIYEIVTGVIFSLINKSSVTPFKKVYKNGKPADKKTSKIITKDKAQQQIDEIFR
jgi:hypothetical protein